MNRQTRERRAHPRISSNVDVQGRHPEQGVVARMVASNLSMGGLYCTSSIDFPEMTRIAVGINLPDPDNGGQSADPLNLEAVVVRREENASATGGEPRFRLALFFTNVDDSARRRLSTYLDR